VGNAEEWRKSEVGKMRRAERWNAMGYASTYFSLYLSQSMHI